MDRRNFLAGTAITGSVLFGGCLATATPSEPTEDETNSVSKDGEGGDGNTRENKNESDNREPEKKEFTVEKADSDCKPQSSEHLEATNDLDEYSPVDTYEETEIGSREGVEESRRPHDIYIWNVDATPEISFRVIDTTNDSVVHDQTYAIPEDHELSISLLEPSDYLIEVTAPAIEAEQTLHVPCARFDCNDSGTQIGVFGNGDVRSNLFSTLVLCDVILSEKETSVAE